MIKQDSEGEGLSKLYKLNAMSLKIKELNYRCSIAKNGINYYSVLGSLLTVRLFKVVVPFI